MAQTIDDLVTQYELANDITSEYAYQLRYAVRRFSLFLSRPALTEDLDSETVNRWLKEERDKGEISDRSRANVRRSLLTIWKRYGLRFNRDAIRSVVVTPRNPEAWGYDDLLMVANAAKQLEGCFANGISRASYMETVLWTAYETGLRRRDLFEFDLLRFDENRRAAITQHKTRRVHVIQITKETESALWTIAGSLKARADTHWSKPLRFPQCLTQFYYWMRRCREIANVDACIRNRSLQHIRRTGATEVVVDGGNAWQFLGHSREGLDRKSYVDARRTIKPTTPSRNRENVRKAE